MEGVYVFRVAFRLEPESDVRVRPRSLETALRRRADAPGDDGWLFFRDNLWRGDVADHDHACALASDALGVPVDDVEFRSLRADREYVGALREAVAADLAPFNAEDVDDALGKYLGSSIDVVDDPTP